MKHVQCTYAFRDNLNTNDEGVENELGKQLHASVRTPNLETSFRLLVQGADPNYFHDVIFINFFFKKLIEYFRKKVPPLYMWLQNQSRSCKSSYY